MIKYKMEGRGYWADPAGWFLVVFNLTLQQQQQPQNCSAVMNSSLSILFRRPQRILKIFSTMTTTT